jgi:uncharacterized protein (TIGR02147 family)
MNPNKDIFNYSDYRAFLKDYYLHFKKSLPGFSHRMFAEMAGFSSSSFFKLIIDGKRNLTKESASKIASVLKLNEQAAGFFEAMVFFLQAKTIEEKKQSLAMMDKYRKRNRPEKLLPKEFDYLKHWYHCVIREMAELPDFKADPEWIVKNSLYPIKKKEAAEALRFLFDSGFISLDERGKARKKEKSLVAAEVEKQNEFATIMRNFHLGMLRIAEKAVGDLPKSERSVTNNTLSLSKNGYETALKRIQQLNYELLELAKTDTDADQIYQININIFPFLKSKRNAGGEA